MRLNDEHYKGLAKALLATKPAEMNCTEWIDHIAGYVELVATSQAIPDSYREVVEHIELCSECDEEFQAILAAVSDPIA
jgi:hypothetical protein